MADPPLGFDGTWGGAQRDGSSQVIVTGGHVIGFYWSGDYTDATNVRVSTDGRTLTFDFPGGLATLTRTGDETASLEVKEQAKVSRLPLKHD